jgi:Flp pilus assembly pilin Flp
MEKFWTFLKREEGTEVAEWGVVLGLIIVLAIAGITTVGQGVQAAWDSLAAVFP